MIFFAVHDPATLDRQCGDVGTERRSVIYHRDEARRDGARPPIAELAQSPTFDAPIVMQSEPVPTGDPAAAHHRECAASNPGRCYRLAAMSPEVAKLRARSAGSLAQR